MADPGKESMSYGVLKLIHQIAVALSFTGFFARGCGMLAGAEWVGSRPVRLLPHVLDTILLGSALALAYQLRLTPASTPWLAAKIIGLLAYICLGIVAFRARSRNLKATAWIAALLVFGYIVSVAITKNAWGVFSI